jgi:hypothetical protein
MLKDIFTAAVKDATQKRRAGSSINGVIFATLQT